jgi:hypothetical protein
MRISEAARRLGTSARMLRYREDLGLLPQVRDPLPWPSQVPAHRPAHGPAHRQFSEADLEAVAAALELERRYDISPASLAFGLRVLAEPPVRAAVADLGRRLGRLPATPAAPGLRKEAPSACCPAPGQLGRRRGLGRRRAPAGRLRKPAGRPCAVPPDGCGACRTAAEPPQPDGCELCGRLRKPADGCGRNGSGIPLR